MKTEINLTENRIKWIFWGVLASLLLNGICLGVGITLLATKK